MKKNETGDDTNALVATIAVSAEAMKHGKVFAPPASLLLCEFVLFFFFRLDFIGCLPGIL